jgi:hypothetical protein
MNNLEVYNQANSALFAGDYQKAIELFNDVLKKGQT